MDPDEQINAEDQAQLDQMREDEGVPVEVPVPVAPDPSDPPADPIEEPPNQPPPRTQMVPHAALHEERERRKDTERQLAEARRSQQTLEDRTNILLRAGLTPGQVADTNVQAVDVPAVDQDPVGHIMGTLKQYGMTLENLAQAERARQEQGRVTQYAQGIESQARALESEFRAVTPDYDGAVTFLRESRNRELAAVGYGNPAERLAIINQEAMGIAARALNQNGNPAEMLYGLAKERGFKSPSAIAPADPADTLRAVAMGQQQARSLGNTRGGAAPALTAERLANMSDADFAKYIDTKAGREALGA